MYLVNAPVVSVRKLQTGIFLLKAHCPQIASDIKPGQFCNIKVSQTTSPLLRRPFSICDVEDEYIYFLFNVHGEGTELLSKKEKGEIIDVLGPLGNGFDFSGNYEIAVFIAGGLGAAPFPYFTRLIADSKEIISLIGGATKNDVITYGINNISAATEDGSLGFNGNVIDLFKVKFDNFLDKKIKVFACGPNPMLRALKEFCIEKNIDTQVSTECAMACGFGICQGCPIEASDEGKYYLVCKDGPVFDVKDVKI